MRSTVLLALALLLSACTSTIPGRPAISGHSASDESAVVPAPPPRSSAPRTSSPSEPPPRAVHVAGYPDGSTVGVGMPIIVRFDRRITDARAFVQHAHVTVNGRPVDGGWYFESSDPAGGYPMEAHFRPESFWPPHARVHAGFDLLRVSAGRGLTFDGRLSSLDFRTGPRNIAIVNDASHEISVSSDGRLTFRFPVSLGASLQSPTARGIKVIMEKGRDIRMRGRGYDDPHVMYTQRLTYGGEYLHAAPWNCRHAPGCTGPRNDIGSADSSNGCTNLRPYDAKALYDFLRIGDIVEFPNANGPQMTLGAGYGDWNVGWSQWQTGGALRTS